ncbi:MAG: putative transposase, partial [Nitrospirota bacterium]|nr:putative transposase [Nitrospirota bacterium]
QVKAMGIKQVLSAPRSQWQRAYVERLIGSIRRECLDPVLRLSIRFCDSDSSLAHPDAHLASLPPGIAGRN